jgi:hypothetical protein
MAGDDFFPQRMNELVQTGSKRFAVGAVFHIVSSRLPYQM